MAYKFSRLQYFGFLFIGPLTQLFYTEYIPDEGMGHKITVLRGPEGNNNPKD